MSLHRSASEQLPRTTRVLHWLTVALVLAMFLLIWGANWSGPGPLGIQLVDLHRSTGATLFLVVLVRLSWRLTHPLPALPDHVGRAERRLAGSVQALLYAGLLTMPALGWAASDSAGDTVRIYGLFALPSILPMDEARGDLLFAAHGWVATGLLLLVALHVSGALWHRIVKNDGVLERML